MKRSKVSLLVCQPKARKTGVQSQVESYQRLKKWNLMPPCLTRWTDESKFEIFWSNRRICKLRRVGERTATPCITPTLKHGGGSVMDWEAFANYKVGDLYQVKGKLNHTGYHKILQDHANYSGMRLVAPGFLLIQDNNPKHTSKLCQRYIKSKNEQHILQLISWPAQSADLNPIELVWDELDRKVTAKQPINATRL